jgi:negative regulator of sigma E activity
MNPSEILSAALDGECSPAELDRLLDAMERDPGLRDAWSRQGQWRDARDGVALPPRAGALTQAVMAAVAAEPAPLRSAHPKLTPLRRRRFATGLGWRPLGGLAAAASVAAVAVVLALRVPDTTPATQVEANPAPVLLPRPAPGELRLVVNPADPEEAWLLLEHHHAAANQAMGGTLRYARFATHTQEAPRPAALRDEDLRR